MPATETVIAVGVAGTAVVAGTGLVVNDQLEKYVRRRFNEKPYTGFPMPEYLTKHLAQSSKLLNAKFAANFQVIAGRGKGKSTMVRHLIEMSPFDDIRNQNLPEVGQNETTRSPTPYKLRNEDNLNTIFLWDMPGLGGKSSLIDFHAELTIFSIYYHRLCSGVMIG